MDRSPFAAIRLLILLAGFVSVGCHRQRPELGEPLTMSTPSAMTTDAPVDRTRPGELAEGDERAFGLVLPRGMKVNGRFREIVFASGTAPLDQVAHYVLRRVNADRSETTPSKTVFSDAVVRGQPGLLVTVEILARDGITELHVRDVTPKPAREGLSTEERWREVGLRPDGTLLDPTRLGAESSP